MTVVVKLLLVPFWLVRIFTRAKSFRDNPILASRVLNTLGLHVLRVVLAHVIIGFRRLCLSGLVEPSQRQAFRRDGFVAVEDLLLPEDFARLVTEIRSCDAPVMGFTQGDTQTRHVVLDTAVLDRLACCRRTISDPRIVRLLKYAAASNTRSHFLIENIKGNLPGTGTDPQKELHADTFHPAMKAWVYLHDVAEDRSAFRYVRGSNRLTWRRLKWEYRRSLTAVRDRNPHGAEGSFRVSEAELTEMGLPAPSTLAVRANTLVVANINGFHCRGPSRDDSARLALYTGRRANPFNPFIGFDLEFTHKARERIARMTLRVRMALFKGQTPDDGRSNLQILDLTSICDGVDSRFFHLHADAEHRPQSAAARKGFST
jgi:hypothetical protein